MTTVTPSWDVKLELTTGLVFFRCYPQTLQIISGITLHVHCALFSPHDLLFLDGDGDDDDDDDDDNYNDDGYDDEDGGGGGDDDDDDDDNNNNNNNNSSSSNNNNNNNRIINH